MVLYQSQNTQKLLQYDNIANHYRMILGILRMLLSKISEKQRITSFQRFMQKIALLNPLFCCEKTKNWN